ncbi:MurR/RpiR family transcriptional regulator [Yersinia enterocolitica]|uniref:MurR/RpiR family transcriptional regulator n=1 Tax=Yersinia enterocolitica TaxID=630 RepID=A0A9P1M4B7_YEREN|nr:MULTISPECIES: MurR/RpiR family transcriptional regulator [Yersinia]AKF37362.1 N-acetylmannosamine kinase [Yersinia enterocolitica]ALG46046.1 N-acetylmannosamine kinase [Yersinia enterocolitica]EKN3336784.1 MurR/RpiR family transcriptional regulator [Yersinia enterocolitica]EKN3343015.1 MurR/RpiR family transcriptional regulator [Yersinia enterocolitica]EKN3386531.1 MurR/RpiR family transcriptional regulator [Yersinia enterocolitica]
MKTGAPRFKPGKILDALGAMQNSLTRSAQRIAAYILAEPAKVTQLSIADLSALTQAGEATIIRFCRTLGYKGFQDFKMDLAIEVATRHNNENSLLDADVQEGDDTLAIGNKLQSAINNVLSETLNLLSIESVEQVVKLLRPADRICIFGVGSSGITAEDAKGKLMRIGLRVDAATNNHFMYMQASLMRPGDVAIGISHSGTSTETVHALKLAKQAGATTVALTHNMGSTITELADYVLINGNRQGQLQGDSIGTKIAQLFVLDLIYALLVKADPAQAESIKRKTTQAVSQNG